MDTQGFLETLGVVNKRSPTTVAAYRREMKHFEAFLRSRRLRVSQVKPKVILDYMKHRDPDNHRRPATTERRLAVLSRFFDYVVVTSNGRIPNPVTCITRPKKQPPRPHPADPVSLEQLLAGITSPRDRTIIRLFLSSGLRLSELCGLNRDSIKAELTRVSAGMKRVLGVARVIGKGGREREVFIDLDTLRELHAYLTTRTDDIPAMFISSRRRRLSTRMVEHLLQGWCRRLGLQAMHPHQLRASFATNLHRMGMPLLEISTLLGHASATTTQRYVQPDLARIRAEYYAALEPHVGPPAENSQH